MILKYTPFRDKFGRQISIGDRLESTEYCDSIVGFGEFDTLPDQYNFTTTVYGYYVEYDDGSRSSLTQTSYKDKDTYCNGAEDYYVVDN